MRCTTTRNRFCWPAAATYMNEYHRRPARPSRSPRRHRLTSVRATTSRPVQERSVKIAARLRCDRNPAMSFKDLLQNWRETAAQPRTVTEYAVRLPVDDAARLAALAEMF